MLESDDQSMALEKLHAETFGDLSDHKPESDQFCQRFESRGGVTRLMCKFASSGRVLDWVVSAAKSLTGTSIEDRPGEYRYQMSLLSPGGKLYDPALDVTPSEAKDFTTDLMNIYSGLTILEARTKKRREDRDTAFCRNVCSVCAVGAAITLASTYSQKRQGTDGSGQV